MRVENPKLEIVVLTSYEAFSIKDPVIEFDVSKDLDEEPNEAEVTIYNLSEGTRGKLITAAEENAPIHLLATPAYKQDKAAMFIGEVTYCRNRPLRPGHETYLHCVSQQINHRARYVDKEFAKGTPISEIVRYFLDGDNEYTGIGLPRGEVETIPDEGILLSQTFSGAAFPLLKRYCWDVGYYCYILDGTINITSSYTPTSPTVVDLPPNILLYPPEPTNVEDALFVQQQTIVETNGSDPFAKRRKKKKKKKKIKHVLYKGYSTYHTMPAPENFSDDYTEYETVDTQIAGMDFSCMLQPLIQPDTIVKTSLLPNRLFRVINVNHHGETEYFHDWTTELETYEYEDQTGDLLG